MIERVLERTTRFVVSHPGVVVATTSLIVIFFLISSSYLKYSYAEWEDSFQPGDVYWNKYVLYYRDFGLVPEYSYIFVKSENVVTWNVYNYMLELGKKIEGIDGVVSVTSPASIIAGIYGSLPTDEVKLKELTERYAYFLVPKDTFALMSIQIEPSQDVMEISHEIQSIISFFPKPPEVTVETTGGPVLLYQIEESVKKDVSRTSSASTILMLLILFVTFSGAVRKKITAFIPMLISMMSVIVVLGVMPKLGLSMSENYSSVVPILIGLAIDYGAQIQNRFEEERIDGKNKDESAVLAVTKTGIALFMAMLTTVLGFLSMGAPRIPALFWFGMLMTIGLLAAYLLSILFLPPFLKLIDREKEAGRRREWKPGILEMLLSAVAKVTSSNPKKVLVVSLVLIVLGTYAMMNVQLETNRRNYAPPDLPALVRFKELERTLGKQDVFTAVLNFDEISAANLRKSDELAQYIVKNEEMVYAYDSLSSLIKTVMGKLPKDDNELNYILDHIPEDKLRRYLSGNKLAIHFFTTAESQNEADTLLHNLKKDFQYFGFDGNYYITGYIALMAHLGEVIVTSMTTMTTVAYILIILFLFAVYRSIRRGLVPLLSISTVLCTMNLVMFLAGIKQTTVSVTLNSIVLGMGIDYSIHIMERYIEEREKLPPREAIIRTVERTGKAIVTSGLTTAGGFGALILSIFPVLSNFGLLACVAIAFSLISSLIIVPAFLIVTESLEGRWLNGGVWHLRLIPA